MPLLIGIDLTDVPRVSSLLERWGERFLTRIFQPGELSRSRRAPLAFAEHVAGRFAAKEAAMKALGVGWRGIAFREITIGKESTGKPTLQFRGRALARARDLGVEAAEVSITHTSTMAAAFVALTTRSEPSA